MGGERAPSWRRTVLWNLLLVAFSLATVALVAQNRLFAANLLLAGILAFNAVRFLIVLRVPVVAYILILLTGLDVFFLARWFLKMGT
jgi:hypothetical protein